MFNATDMVGALMQNVLTGSSQSRIEHALSDRGLGQPGGVLTQLLGGATGGSGTGVGGMLGSLLTWPNPCLVALVPRVGVGIRSPWAGSARLLGRSWEVVGVR
jgi:hypothetical protein